MIRVGVGGLQCSMQFRCDPVEGGGVKITLSLPIVGERAIICAADDARLMAGALTTAADGRSAIVTGG